MTGALLIGAIIATVLVHEAGHAATAALLRLPWRPALVRCRPAVVIGRDDLDLTRRQVVLTAAGGPLANIVLAAVGYSLGQGLIVALGVVFALANLLPLPLSDGSRMVRPGRAIAHAKAAAAAR